MPRVGATNTITLVRAIAFLLLSHPYGMYPGRVAGLHAWISSSSRQGAPTLLYQSHLFLSNGASPTVQDVIHTAQWTSQTPCRPKMAPAVPSSSSIQSNKRWKEAVSSKDLARTTTTSAAATREALSPWQHATGPARHQQQSLTATATFTPGTAVLVEVISFGPLGASVDVIGLGHHPEINPQSANAATSDNDDNPSLNEELAPPQTLITPNTEPVARGLILQREIHFFRQSRGYVDVYRGEILNAFVERVRWSNTNNDNISTDVGRFKLDICLRTFGAEAKAHEASLRIWQHLSSSSTTLLVVPYGNSEQQLITSVVPIGTKSSRVEIARVFPGLSKITFKRALQLLEMEKKIWSSEFAFGLRTEQASGQLCP